MSAKDWDKLVRLFPKPKRKRKNMPLNKKGKEIKRAMEKEYGKKKGTEVFYKSENKGTIKGVTKSGKKK